MSNDLGGEGLPLHAGNIQSFTKIIFYPIDAVSNDPFHAGRQSGPIKTFTLLPFIGFISYDFAAILHCSQRLCHKQGMPGGQLKKRFAVNKSNNGIVWVQ